MSYACWVMESTIEPVRVGLRGLSGKTFGRGHRLVCCSSTLVYVIMIYISNLKEGKRSE